MLSIELIALARKDESLGVANVLMVVRWNSLLIVRFLAIYESLEGKPRQVRH